MGERLAKLPEHFIESGALLSEITSGLHCCYLDEPIHLEYVSDSFCEMLGYTRKEIHEYFNDKYTCMCYPSDVEIFMENILYLSKNQAKRTFEYRMVKKTGEIIYVRDTMASRIMNDGVMRGYSIIEDMGSEESSILKPDNLSLRQNAEVPYGTIEFSIDEGTSYPKIVALNTYMRRILGIPAEITLLKEIERDVQFLLPWKERQELLNFFSTAVVDGPALKAENAIFYSRFRTVIVSGWIRKGVDNYGHEHFYATYIESSKLCDVQNDPISLLIELLYDNYDEILFLDIVNNALKAYKSESPLLPEKNVGYNLKEMAQLLIENCLDSSVKAKAYRSFDELRDNLYCKELPKSHFTFLAAQKDDLSNPQKYYGRIVTLAPGQFLILAKKDSRDNIPIQISDSVVPTSVNQHTNYCGTIPKEGVYAKTFGYFELYVNGEAINFRSAKAKELMALLIDRRGGYLSPSEAISYLWEDEPLTKTVQARYRKTFMRLRDSLREHGVESIISSIGTNRRVEMSMIRSDLVDYLSGKDEFSHLYRGYYMTNYSWGEVTCSELSSTVNFADE